MMQNSKKFELLKLFIIFIWIHPYIHAWHWLVSGKVRMAANTHISLWHNSQQNFSDVSQWPKFIFSFLGKQRKLLNSCSEKRTWNNPGSIPWTQLIQWNLQTLKLLTKHKPRLSINQRTNNLNAHWNLTNQEAALTKKWIITGKYNDDCQCQQWRDNSALIHIILMFCPGFWRKCMNVLWGKKSRGPWHWLPRNFAANKVIYFLHSCWEANLHVICKRLKSYWTMISISSSSMELIRPSPWHYRQKLACCIG